MKISTLGSRFTGFARNALTAATRKNQKPEARNQKLSPPLALASIIRPQVRERWLLPQVAAITPTYIEMTLRGALAGAHIPQWELFNLMEDTWPRLRKNLLELKMAVRNRRAIFEAYRDEDEEESPTATERMKLVSAALRTMQPDPSVDEGAFDEMVGDILDAWFKGVSVLEIDWQVAQTRALGRFVAPRAARWVSPVSYAWDGDLRVGLADDTQQMLTAFPADRFLVAKCKTKSGSVLGGALLRPLVWWWCAANFSADWLLNFAQVFGLPLRWATYDPTAPQETVDRLCEMLQKMGSAGWGAFPNGTALEVKAEGQKSGHDTPQGDLLDRADKQCDLLVLGQTLTTDTGNMGHGGGSHALGRVHADVRASIIDAAAKFAAGVIEQQLIPSILRLNYGDTEEAPTLTFQERTEDDLTARAQWIATLAGAGAGGIIPLDWLGKTFGIRTLILSQLWQPSRWPLSLIELDGEKPDIPAVPGGVMLIGEQTRRVSGALRTSWTFEGIGGDGKSVTFKDRSNSPDYSFEPGFSQVSITKHPNRAALKATWGGQVIWPEFVGASGGGGPVKDNSTGKPNPMFGHDDFFRVEGTYSFRYASTGYGSAVQGVGKIATSLPGNPPPVQDGRNWLKAPSPVQRRGPVYDITEVYWLSGAGGWPPQIYSDNPAAPAATGSGASNALSASSGILPDFNG